MKTSQAAAQQTVETKSLPPQNKLFQLNKQIILTCRKLETGPLENYVHMATLIHKVNLLMLEYDNIQQLRNIIRLVYTKQLLNSIIDFSMNTDQFASFGLRLLELLALDKAQELVSSDVLAVVFGLLRTNDYETILQCFTFLKVLMQNGIADQKVPLIQLSPPKLLLLVLKTVNKHPEIEHIAQVVEIVNMALGEKELRAIIISSELKENENYLQFLRGIELKPEVRAIKQLHKKVQRQLKELEAWSKATNKTQ